MGKRNVDPSIKIGCKAELIVRKFIGEQFVEIERIDHHTGHDPSSLRSFQESRIPAHLRAWLEDKVNRGFDWGPIKSLLALEDKAMEVLEQGLGNTCGPSSIPESMRLGYQDVYNFVRKRFNALANKDTDGWESLKKWEAELKAEGWDTLLKECIGNGDPGQQTQPFVFCFMDKWQNELLSEFGQTACLDSTHNTAFSIEGKGSKVFLYTVVIKHRGAGRGIPASFCITTEE
ncbi:hypothetical protein BT69DRAFT_1223391, partial [Atractiella rhizophila]